MSNLTRPSFSRHWMTALGRLQPLIDAGRPAAPCITLDQQNTSNFPTPTL